jgi:hypothetical protein
MAPTFRASGGVDRDKRAAPRAQVERIAYLERRRFRTPALLRHVAGTEGPRTFEPAHVLAIDLIERRVTLRVVGPAVGGPICADLHGRVVRHGLREWFGHRAGIVWPVGLRHCNA